MEKMDTACKPICIENKAQEVDLLATRVKRSPHVSSGIILGILATMFGSSLPAGHNLGVMNTPQQQIRKWITTTLKQEYGVEVTPTEEYLVLGCVVSVFLCGALVGSGFASHIANKFGRRNGLLLVHSVFLMSGFIIICCQHIYLIELMLIGRLTAGLAAGAATGLVPLYLSEIAPPSWRGVMGTLFPLGICSGILISQILGVPSLLGKDSTWAYLVGGHFLYVLLGIPLHCFLPLSPTHLFLNKMDAAAAHKVLWKLRDGDICTVNEEENALITAAMEKEVKKVQGGSWKVFRDRRFYRSFACVIILNAGQQLVGINAVFFYSTLVFMNAGLSLNTSQATSLCAGIPNLIMALLAVPLVRYVRRRVLLMTSLVLYCVCQILLVVSVYYVTWYSWAAWGSFIAIFASVLTYGLGLGPVPYMIGTEIFPSELRGIGLGIGGLSNWTANLLVGLLFPLVQAKLGIFSFIIFIGFCILLLIFVYLSMYSY